tara:strand:+ start:614 stop:892 length:279 start_codon:yes stop_codon:yes gene_type:complete
MMQETSKKAYREINQEGVVTNQKQVILDCVRENNRGFGMSLKEISRSTGIEINAVSGRVNTLKKENMLAIHSKRKCSISMRTINAVKIYNGI